MEAVINYVLMQSKQICAMQNAVISYLIKFTYHLLNTGVF